MEILNPQYQKMADYLLDILGNNKWEKILYEVTFYLPDEFGSVLSSMRITAYNDGTHCMYFTSDSLSSEMEIFRAQFGELQNLCWTTMIFELSASGDLNVDLGYKKIVYDGQ